MNTQACRDLADAIIIKAAKDYRAALRRKRNNPGSVRADYRIREIERFFRSEWFTCLTDVKGEALIERLRKETRV